MHAYDEEGRRRRIPVWESARYEFLVQLREAFTFLCSRSYSRSVGKEIYFDLCDQLSLRISREQVEAGYSYIEFEDVLQYVAFPNLQIGFTSNANADKATVKSDGNGRSDMTVLFDFLRNKKVKRIIRVIVDDKDDVPHSEEAIQRALKDFSVEIWDWQKYEICTETILAVAPDVEEVHLWWSGNNAVLRGWSEDEDKGIRGLKRSKKLYLHARQVCHPTLYPV